LGQKRRSVDRPTKNQKWRISFGFPSKKILHAKKQPLFSYTGPIAAVPNEATLR